jgi:hypothetical protein
MGGNVLKEAWLFLICKMRTLKDMDSSKMHWASELRQDLRKLGSPGSAPTQANLHPQDLEHRCDSSAQPGMETGGWVGLSCPCGSETPSSVCLAKFYGDRHWGLPNQKFWAKPSMGSGGRKFPKFSGRNMTAPRIFNPEPQSRSSLYWLELKPHIY